MAQETFVTKLAPPEQRRLKERLESGDFDWRSVPHAVFSVRGEGVVATLYGSGKLVVQGGQPELFAQRYLERVPEPPSRPAGPSPDLPLVGSDEAGKGDYFGSLVVVALRAEPTDREELIRAGVADSKTLDDQRIRRLAAALRERYEHAVEVLDPPTYNRVHARVKNLNPMLADLHARAIRSVVREGDQVLIDRFAAKDLMSERLEGVSATVYQQPRAEREPAVAAASIIARAVFVETLAALSDDHGVDLHKGAGAPTDAAARKFLRIHGPEALSRVAKVHFKNTRKLGL